MNNHSLDLKGLQTAFPVQDLPEHESPWPPITRKWEIRILDLLPGRLDDPIACQTRLVLLTDKPHYEAVSYVWGSRDVLDIVKISGFEVQVTTNLSVILRQFRYPDRKRTLWIDQLCINQDDNLEKTNQVALMGDIYRSCTECQIWLGKVEDLGLSIKDAENAFAGVRAMANPSECPESNLPSMFIDDEGKSRAKRAFGSIFTYFGNPWWSRVWTVQELILPSEVTMNCGNLKIDLKEVKLAATNYRDGKIPNPWLQTQYDHSVNELDEFTGVVTGLEYAQDGEDPLGILWRFCYRQAWDSRDMIYSLIGLFPLSYPWTMAPDYSLSTSQVYARATIELVRSMNDLMPLIGMRGLPRHIDNLPTWASDFTAYRESHPRTWNRYTIASRYNYFKAAGHTSAMVDVVDDRTIRMQGFNCDSIMATGRFLGKEYWTNVNPNHICELTNDWKIWLQQLYGPDSDLEAAEFADQWDAFLRTLLGDYITDDEFVIRRASSDDLEGLKTFLNGTGTMFGSFRFSLLGNIVNQALFRTSKGWIGTGPATMATGDEVWVLYGGNMPFILRPGTTHNFVGEAYVHGVMHGEAMGMGLSERYVTLT